MMLKPIDVLSYAQVQDALEKGRCHLLLGNGFSIACNPKFSYGRLYDFACENGISEHAKGVFEYLGTNNFEGVLRLLKDGYWIAKHYAYRKPNRVLKKAFFPKNLSGNFIAGG